MDTGDVAVAEKSPGAVAPFAVMADHPRNCDLRIQSIPGVVIRSLITGRRTVYSHVRKQEMIPQDQAAYLGMYPDIPGQEIHVNPAKLSYVIRDPLHGNEELCQKIQRAKTETDGIKCPKVEGVPPIKGELDVHRMKTLVRELIRMVASGEAKVVNGVMPTIAQADTLPGRYLLNPGAIIQNGQPTYEDEYETWKAKINQLS